MLRIFMYRDRIGAFLNYGDGSVMRPRVDVSTMKLTLRCTGHRCFRCTGRHDRAYAKQEQLQGASLLDATSGPGARSTRTPTGAGASLRGAAARTLDADDVRDFVSFTSYLNLILASHILSPRVTSLAHGVPFLKRNLFFSYTHRVR